MIAAAFACLPIFSTGHRIARWAGGLFLGYYVACPACVVTAATVPALHRTMAIVLAGFVIPLTAITLGMVVIRQLRRGAIVDSDAKNESSKILRFSQKLNDSLDFRSLRC